MGQGASVRVLVVEDEVGLAGELATGLRRTGFAVDVAHDGGEALDKAALSTYDLVVLDRDLPVVHGDEVCRRLVAAAPGPRIIMLTAAAGLDDRVEGLGLGADDYLAKPFAMRELVARVQALARRAGPATMPVIVVGDLRIDTSGRLVHRAGTERRLTRKEFGVLEILAQSPGRVVGAEELLERVWDEHADPFTNAVRVTIMTLRRKLGDPPLVETVKGVGYRLSS